MTPPSHPFPPSSSPSSHDHRPGDPILPEVRMNIYKAGAPAIGRVTRTELCTRGGKKAASIVRHIEIDVSGTELASGASGGGAGGRGAGGVLPGQSIGVVPPGVDEKGRPHQVRLYSVASPTKGEDGEGRIISTTVKRTIDENWEDHRLFLGVASNHLCDLKVGDEVRLTGPSGKRFLLPVEAAGHDYLFFATGTGIAPFRGMIMDLIESKAIERGVRVALVMGVPYESDLLYDGFFRGLEKSHPNFVYLPALSRQAAPNPPTTTTIADPADERPMYVQDRLVSHAEVLRPMLESPRTLVYICGISGMELGILRNLWRTVGPAARGMYMNVDEAIAGDEGAWDKKMIHRQIRLTRRVFMEVYA